MKTGGPDDLLTDSILFPSHATALQKFGKPTTCDGVFGGPSCQHCGHHRSHSFLGSPLLPFLLYFGICLLVEIFSHSSSGTTESPRLHGGTRFAILSRRPLLEATWAKTAKLTGRGEEKERFRQLGLRQFPLFVLLLGNPHNFQQFTVARSKVQFADPPFTTGLKR